ncbi:MAG TPA: MBL fold metallo-hydrolase [Candidatus Didemnitutus sp.]|nr:MBL fold metallo-hydrolase [Candidatus Didemnitutus sp.]
MIVRIRGAISNSYLLLGKRPVLVDAGAPGDLKRILSALKHHQIEPASIALILLTHGHSDHAGCAAELRRRSGAPVAMHVGDAQLARTGQNGVLAAQETAGRLIRPFVNESYEAFEPDIVFREGLSFEPYGIRARVLPTPGHTAGSISVVFANGEALIGDVLRGSLTWPNVARPAYFCNDPEVNSRSLVRLAREGLLRCHPGQFGPFPGTQLGKFIDPSDTDVLTLSGETV